MRCLQHFVLAPVRRYTVVTPTGTNVVTSVAYPSNIVKFTWSTIQIAGANIADGTYAMHDGCGNANDVARCDAFLQKLGLDGERKLGRTLWKRISLWNHRRPLHWL